MALNLFKKNKPKKEKKADPADFSKPANKDQPPIISGDASLVLRGAYVTEKAGQLNSFNQYVFKVAPRVNKISIRKAVEKMYGVKVRQVRIAVVPAKKRMMGQQKGEKAGFKKAMVKLAEGQKIDIMPK